MKTSKKGKSKRQRHKVNTDLLSIAHSMELLLLTIGETIVNLEHTDIIGDAYQKLDEVINDIEGIEQVAESLSKENLQKILSVLYCISEPVCSLNFIRDADGMEGEAWDETIDVRQDIIDILSLCLSNHGARVEALAGELIAEWQLTYCSGKVEPSNLTDDARSKPSMSKPLSLIKWASIFGVSVGTMRSWRDDDERYSFVQVSKRKWSLPIEELPGEYLLKYQKHS